MSRTIFLLSRYIFYSPLIWPKSAVCTPALMERYNSSFLLIICLRLVEQLFYNPIQSIVGCQFKAELCLIGTYFLFTNVFFNKYRIYSRYELSTMLIVS
nr:MAG TPA: hypothetical protein [Caudoviricetes sp.]